MPENRRSPARVLLIGWDGADWDWLDPLLAEGKMPNLAGLIQRGCRGRLATLHPPVSPMLWTSMATGKHPLKHGVLGFVEPDPNGPGVRPISGRTRRTRALWNMLTLEGMNSNVIGWWPTHPVEQIQGVMVSDQFTRAAPSQNGGESMPEMPPGSVYPERLIPEIADLRISAEMLGAEHLLPFVPDAAKIDQKKDRRLAVIAGILAEQSSVHAAATAVMQLEPWDFMGVYYNLLDRVCHHFMACHPPRMPWVTEGDFQLYRGVLEAACRFQDMMLGVILELAGPDVTVLLVSDHGFVSGSARRPLPPLEPAGIVAQHRRHGIVVAAGPGIRTGETVDGASLLDICPTVLCSLGLPVGEDMDGRPLIEFWKRAPDIRRIDSWDSVEGNAGDHGRETALPPEQVEVVMRQLAALGYIDPVVPEAGATEARRLAEREWEWNRARLLMASYNLGEAGSLLERLLDENPEETRFGIALTRCLQARGKIGEARRVLTRTLVQRRRIAQEAEKELYRLREEHAQQATKAISEETRRRVMILRRRAVLQEANLHYLMASLLRSERRWEEAMDYIEVAIQEEPGRAIYRIEKGWIELGRGNWQAARDGFLEGLDRDPGNPAVRLGLARAFLDGRRPFEAAAEAYSATQLDFRNPVGHYLFGLALRRLGRLQHAEQAYQVALSLNPAFLSAHQRLIHLYEKDLLRPEKAAMHRAEIERWRKQANQAKREPLPDALESRESSVISIPFRPVPEESGECQLVVVSGLPRSGTSLLMQMLNAGGVPVISDGERKADSHNPGGYWEDARVKRLVGERETSWLRQLEAGAIKVVVPLLTLLPEDLPMRILFIERPLPAVIASQARMLQDTDDGEAIGAPDGGRSERIHQAYQQLLRDAVAFLERIPAPVLQLSYDELIADPKGSAMRIAEFTGRTCDLAKMVATVDPNLRHF